MGKHIIGRKIGEHRYWYRNILDDEKFKEVEQNGLPYGWWAWHLENGEDIYNSRKVQLIAKLPYLVQPSIMFYTGQHIDIDPDPLVALREEWAKRVVE